VVSSFSWSPGLNSLVTSIHTWGDRMLDDTVGRAESQAGEIEAWMKQNAPWQDDTGAARETLSAVVENRSRTGFSLRMSHGVEYGIYLERMQAGRFAILGPALAYWGSRFVSGLGSR
jgi:hypothetical protein